MNQKIAKWIFYAGTLSSAILFLVLTWDTNRQFTVLTNAQQISGEVIAGKKVFQKYNCNDCHTILGFGGYYAPDLTRVSQRRGEAYFRQVVSQPEVVLVNSFRKMPQLTIPSKEQEQLVAFFTWVNEINNQDWPPQDSKKRRQAGTNQLMQSGTLSAGATIFKTNGCFACHKLGGIGGKAGPALDNVGARLDMQTIKKQITNPQSRVPDSVMPAFNQLSDGDVQVLAEFLAAQKGGEK